MLQPCNGLVLIEPDPDKKTTTGGIILPDRVKGSILTGTIRAVGPGRPLESGQRVDLMLSPGDRVLFKAEKDRAGNRNLIEIETDGVKCWLMNNEEILGVFRGTTWPVAGDA